jgi:hypothetical protein
MIQELLEFNSIQFKKFFFFLDSIQFKKFLFRQCHDAAHMAAGRTNS